MSNGSVLPPSLFTPPPPPPPPSLGTLFSLSKSLTNWHLFPYMYIHVRAIIFNTFWDLLWGKNSSLSLSI